MLFCELRRGFFMGKRAVAVPMLRIVLKTQKHLTVRPVGRAPSCDPAWMIGEGHNLCLGVPSTCISSAAAGGLYAAAHDVHGYVGAWCRCRRTAPWSVKFIDVSPMGSAASPAKSVRSEFTDRIFIWVATTGSIMLFLLLLQLQDLNIKSVV